MSVEKEQRMARGLLSERQQEIVAGADVDDGYKRSAKSKIRRQIEQAADDMELLRENEPELYEYARDLLCGKDTHAGRLDRIEQALEEEGLELDVEE